jgi:hypothetical protein
MGGLALFAVALSSVARADVSGSEVQSQFDFRLSQDPWITLRAGALAMHRSDQRAEVLLSEQITDRPFLLTSEVDPGWTAGSEIELTLQLTADLAFEFDWFQVGDWSQGHTIDGGTGTLANEFPGTLTSGRLTASSTLHNFEYNFQHALTDRLEALAGFRFIELEDVFNARYEDSINAISQDAAVVQQNRLYGLQLGAKAVLWQRGPWELDGWVKTGVFGNQARSKIDIVYAGILAAPPAFRARDSVAALVGDQGLRAMRRVGQHAEFYGGYRLMIIHRVALASHQVDNVGNFFIGGPAVVTTDATPFFHGAELGFVFRY